jgi:hypothetical protein
VISKEEFYAAIDGHPKLRAAYFRAVNASTKSLTAERRYTEKPGIWSRALLGQARSHATSTMTRLLDGFEFDGYPLRASDRVTLASIVIDAARLQFQCADEKISVLRAEAPRLQPSFDDIQVFERGGRASLSMPHRIGFLKR